MQKMSGDSGVYLLPQVLAADELNEIFVVVIEHLL